MADFNVALKDNQKVSWNFKVFDKLDRELPSVLIAFTSSDPSIAEVVGDGQDSEVFGRSPGTATITAHAVDGDIPDQTLDVVVGAAPARMEGTLGTPELA